jgi:hypothetical protein
MPKNKTPKWVLFDQIHLDVSIKTDLSEFHRKDLENLLDSETLKSLLETVIVGPCRKSIKVDVSR